MKEEILGLDSPAVKRLSFAKFCLSKKVGTSPTPGVRRLDGVGQPDVAGGLPLVRTRTYDEGEQEEENRT